MADRDPVTFLAALAQQLGVELPDNAQQLVRLARDRMAGDFEVDEFGCDPVLSEQIFLPVVKAIAMKWFRASVSGAENLPEGPALLVSNHAGALPIDSMVLQAMTHEVSGRMPRTLGADLVFKTPFSHDFARRIGATVACPEDAARLLEEGHLVSVFPEGFKGLGKLYSERYRLQRFGRGGFVATAIRAGVPIVPVSIVGSEEIFPLISRAPLLANLMGFPYFPVTPFFPLLGPLGMIPLPSRWMIDFAPAVTTDELPPGAADDPMTVFQVTDQVRLTIQNRLYQLLEERPGAFR